MRAGRFFEEFVVSFLVTGSYVLYYERSWERVIVFRVGI